MKRLLCIILILALLLPLCACTQQEDAPEVPAALYYLRIQDPEDLHHGSADSVIAPEIIEGKSYSDLNSLIGRYLQGPESASLEAPFPEGTALIGTAIADKVLTVTLSDSFASLTGIRLTLACACLTMTCLELAEVDSVVIRADSAALDGKRSVTMDASILMLLDTGGTQPTETEG